MQNLLDAIFYEAAYQMSLRFDHRQSRETWFRCAVLVAL